MNKEDRYEQYDFSWGTYLGFLYFFSRKMLLPGLLHIVLLIITGAAIWLTRVPNPGALKWILLGFVIVELGFLTYHGFTANRFCWNYCNWKDAHKFATSNSIWGFFGRLLILLRVLNVVAYGFLGSPGRIAATPGWIEIVGYILVPVVIALIVWRVRGPIWAVALNTLKESVSKLEVVTLFIIGVVFVIFFNAAWQVPAVQDTVVDVFKASQPAAGGAEEPFKVPGEVDELEISTTPQTRAFAEDAIQKGSLRLKVQVAAFLFGEFFIALICFALGIFLVTGEISRGVVLTVLPKPIGRGEYIIGKILGGWLIVVICFEAIAVVALLFALPYRGDALDNIPNILQAMLLMPIKYAILIAIVTYLSLWLPEAAAGFVGLTLFIAGHFSERMLDMATDEFIAMPLLSHATKASYVLLPHLSEVFSPVILDPNWTDFTSAGPMFEWSFWAVLYFAIITTAAVLSFRKRSL